MSRSNVILGKLFSVTVKSKIRGKEIEIQVGRRNMHSVYSTNVFKDKD